MVINGATRLPDAVAAMTSEPIRRGKSRVFHVCGLRHDGSLILKASRLRLPSILGFIVPISSSEGLLTAAVGVCKELRSLEAGFIAIDTRLQIDEPIKVHPISIRAKDTE